MSGTEFAVTVEQNKIMSIKIKELKAERDLLLSQLVVLDGEDVTVQVTQEQFEEYNKLKAENKKLKQCLNEIEKLCKGSLCIFSDNFCDDLSGEILQKIKEVNNEL